jgi:hypothetical protein
MATRQSLAPGLTEFAAACFSGGKNCKTGKRFCKLSKKFHLAQGLLNRVVNINDLIGQEK